VTTTTFTPTNEQQAALDLFTTGQSMAIQAGAGTGKTATLKLLAESAPDRKGQYVAFNKAIVEEAKAKFPANVAANTAHSLAMRAVGKDYRHRLPPARMKGDEIARRLFIDPFTARTEMGEKRLAPGFLAGFVMRAVRTFAQSADAQPGLEHFPYLDGIDLPHPDGRRTFIYEWRGCEDALAEFAARGAQTTYLSQSFRFGPAIADVANELLGRIEGAELRLTGSPVLDSTVGKITQPDCVLTRTNAAAMRVVLEELAAHRRPHLVGGGTELLAFARAANDLMNGKRTSHPELACFDSWEEVQEYVDFDQQGDELRLMVKLMDEYGPERILRALDHMPAERDADLVISTAHKSKGREWDRVALAADFPDDELKEVGVPELRLLYVAVTRARLVLDVSLVALLNKRDGQPEIVGVAPVVSPGMIGADGAAPTSPAQKPCPYCGRTDVRDETGLLVFDGNHLGCTPTGS
jgi:ABC-type dipeptide/oligopeptide/nickel transport system ATPase subunit